MKIYNGIDSRISRKKDISPKYLLLLFTIICVVLIMISYFASDRIVVIKKVTSAIITPIQNGVDKVGVWTDSKFKNMQDIEKLNKEKEELEEELASCKEKLNQYQSELIELAELREIYALDDEYPELEKTAAHVFAKDSTSWFSVFYIDKGTKQGVYKGANVMCKEGLAGIVVEAYDDYAKVRSIIDDESNVSVKIIPTNALCTLDGDLNDFEKGYLSIINIDKDAAVAVGDKVVTSHVSDRYHPGIVIGYISEVSLDSNNLTLSAKLTPAVDFSNIGVVLVVTDERQTVKE